MREAELIALGFDKIDVLDSESNNGFDYYYYKLEISPEIQLVSCDSDTVDEDGWFVRSFDWPEVVITQAEDITLLQELFKKWTK
jgi:hypothetical protein